MASQNESLDLVREKQKLDIFLSSIAAVRIPHKVLEKKTIIAVETEGTLPVSNHNESFDLIREKREMDNFLSHIMASLLPNGPIEEKPAVSVGMEEQLRVSDGVPVCAESETPDLSDSESVPDQLGEKEIVSDSKTHEEGKISVDHVKDIKLAKEEAKAKAEAEARVRAELEARPAEVAIAPEEAEKRAEEEARSKAEKSTQLLEELRAKQEEGARVREEAERRFREETKGQFQTLVPKKTPDSVDVQLKATRKSDSPNVLRSDTMLKTDKATALKMDNQSKTAPASLGGSMDAKRKTQADRPFKKEGKQSSRGKRIRLITFITVFVVFIVMIQGYLWIYPNAGHETVQWMCSEFPIIGQLLGVEKGSVNNATNQVEFIDVKQRFVSNESLGSMRVIEGVVANHTEVSLSKIRVTGELLGSRGELLAARVAYCGNIISDEILERLKTDEISYISSVLQSENISNKRIIPKSQIPFMIVFTHEPAGVVKATVTAVGEKVSP